MFYSVIKMKCKYTHSFLSNKQCVIAPDWYYMVLYDDIAVVMWKMMTSPVVLMFMKRGWLPLVCMKDCLMQIDQKWGLHGSKLASCNLHVHSFLALFGFVDT
jgi:hypothetical protein